MDIDQIERVVVAAEQVGKAMQTIGICVIWVTVFYVLNSLFGGSSD